ncbi:hypothetical protein MTO96_049192 [Rhipicephalus appendiculatus]
MPSTETPCTGEQGRRQGDPLIEAVEINRQTPLWRLFHLVRATSATGALPRESHASVPRQGNRAAHSLPPTPFHRLPPTFPMQGRRIGIVGDLASVRRWYRRGFYAYSFPFSGGGAWYILLPFGTTPGEPLLLSEPNRNQHIGFAGYMGSTGEDGSSLFQRYVMRKLIRFSFVA